MKVYADNVRATAHDVWPSQGLSVTFDVNNMWYLFVSERVQILCDVAPAPTLY